MNDHVIERMAVSRALERDAVNRDIRQPAHWRVLQHRQHLRSSDFFDVETHPELTFVSTSVGRDGDDWAVTGDLTIKGTAKPVTIVFEQTGSAQDPFGNVRVGFEGDVTVNRKDWGLTWNAAVEGGGVLVSDKITINIDVQLAKQA